MMTLRITLPVAAPLAVTPLATALFAVMLMLGDASAQCSGSICYQPLPPAGGASPGIDPRLRSAVCRVIARGPRGESLGSGALIAISPPAGYVLTCGHLFDTGNETTEVAFPSGERYQAVLAGLDRPNDVALLRIATPSIRPLSVAATAANNQRGSLTCCGYGGQGLFRAIRGPIVGYATAIGASSPSLRIRGAVRSGDSGGPVLDAAGRLVGVIWGVRNGVTYASFGQPIRRMLARITNRIAPRLPISDSIASQQQPPARPNTAASASRLAAIESRLKELTPCRCPDDVLTRSDLAGLAKASDLAELARSSEVNAAIGSVKQEVERTPSRLKELREQLTVRLKTAAADAVRERFSGLDLKGLAWSKTQVVLASLGIGGPIGLALLAGRLFLRSRRRRRRRGLGGPRSSRFSAA